MLVQQVNDSILLSSRFLEISVYLAMFCYLPCLHAWKCLSRFLIRNNHTCQTSWDYLQACRWYSDHYLVAFHERFRDILDCWTSLELQIFQALTTCSADVWVHSMVLVNLTYFLLLQDVLRSGLLQNGSIAVQDESAGKLHQARRLWVIHYHCIIVYLFLVHLKNVLWRLRTFLMFWPSWFPEQVLWFPWLMHNLETQSLTAVRHLVGKP